MTALSKKPVKPMAQVASSPLRAEDRWRFADFELAIASRELRRAGKPVSIEPKPLNLWLLLLRAPGELVTKEELIDALWDELIGDAYVTVTRSTRTVPGVPPLQMASTRITRSKPISAPTGSAKRVKPPETSSV